MMLDEDIWDNTKQFDYLFECARKKGLTTAVAIAEESGVDANIISRLKTGRQKSPDLIQVVKLYKACGASLDYGFGIEGCDTDELQRELEKLLSGIASGERDALERLYELTRTAVYGFALSCLGSTHDAGDAMQNTYVRIWSAAGQYKPHGTPMAWIFTICRNICLMKLRKSGREAYLDDGEWNAIPEKSESLTFEDREILGDALKKLDETERCIVILHAVSGMKHREIASELDMALATVLSKYARAIKKLKKHIEGGGTNE